MRDILDNEPDADLSDLRAAMSVRDDDDPARRAWRRLQVRQAFRLALEAWFFWCLDRLQGPPLSTAQLVGLFQEDAGGWAASDRAGGWLRRPRLTCPVDLQHRLSFAVHHAPNILPAAIARTLAFCFTEPDIEGDAVQHRPDRLPLRRARAEARGWANETPATFLGRMME